MIKDQDLRAGRHCVFALHVHLIFVTKYRHQIFDEDALARLEQHFRRVANDFEATVVECNGEVDHVHLLINYPPKIAVTALVRSLKGVSSRMLRHERPDIAKHYWRNQLWSPSYFAASCGGAPLEIIRQYVESQTRPVA